MAAKAAALEEKVRAFEEQQKLAADQKAAADQAVAEREALLLGRGYKRGSVGYQVGDKVDVLCTPVGAAAGTKAFISGEVAHRNPDGSVDVILSDGRMRQEVPLSEVKMDGFPDRGGASPVRGNSAGLEMGRSPSDLAK